MRNLDLSLLFKDKDIDLDFNARDMQQGKIATKGNLHLAEVPSFSAKLTANNFLAIKNDLATASLDTNLERIAAIVAAKKAAIHKADSPPSEKNTTATSETQPSIPDTSGDSAPLMEKGTVVPRGDRVPIDAIISTDSVVSHTDQIANDAADIAATTGTTPAPLALPVNSALTSVDILETQNTEQNPEAMLTWDALPKPDTVSTATVHTDHNEAAPASLEDSTLPWQEGEPFPNIQIPVPTFLHTTAAQQAAQQFANMATEEPSAHHHIAATVAPFASTKAAKPADIKTEANTDLAAETAAPDNPTTPAGTQSPIDADTGKHIPLSTTKEAEDSKQPITNASDQTSTAIATGVSIPAGQVIPALLPTPETTAPDGSTSSLVAKVATPSTLPSQIQDGVSSENPVTTRSASSIATPSKTAKITVPKAVKDSVSSSTPNEDAEALQRRRARREQRRRKNKTSARLRKHSSQSSTAHNKRPKGLRTWWRGLLDSFKRPPPPAQPPDLPEKVSANRATQAPATAEPTSQDCDAVKPSESTVQPHDQAHSVQADVSLPPCAVNENIAMTNGHVAASTASKVRPKAKPTVTKNEKFTFVRDAQRRAFWRKPKVRAGLVAGIVIGLLSLTSQWAYQHRSSLAARIPLARATFDALRWQVPAWQNIEAIEIEDSDFLKNPDNSYQLRLSLRNDSSHPVAMPALELALLDDDEQVVTQRVIISDPALPMPQVIPPRGRWDATTEVVVQLPPALGRYGISGYRIAVFYP